MALRLHPLIVDRARDALAMEIDVVVIVEQGNVASRFVAANRAVAVRVELLECRRRRWTVGAGWPEVSVTRVPSFVVKCVA